MFNQKSAFTLVELIVVITILAILGTIAFISLQGYSSQSRDATRISDLSSMKTTLELFQLEAGKYPQPTNGVDITYSGAVVWNQGTFGKTVFTNVKNLDKIPTDSLTSSEYTYSVTADKNEFQLGGIVEGDVVAINTPPLTPPYQGGGLAQQTNAGETSATAYITGDYNGLMTKSNTGTICKILAVPAIITNDISVTDLQQIITNNSFVFGGYKNLPSSFKTSKFKYDGGFTFTPNNLISYTDTGSCMALTDKTSYLPRVSLLKGLQDSYTGTILKNDGEIKNILGLDISTSNPSNEVIKYAGNFVNNNLGGNIVVDTLLVINGCAVQPTYTNATFTEGTATQANQAWQNTNAGNPCYYSCTNGYSGSSCNIAPYSTCIGAHNPVPFSAITTYGGCDTPDIIVCSGSGTGYTLSACNAGAITAWTNQTFSSQGAVRNSTINSWAGGLYQWGNNSDISYSTTSTTKVSCTTNSTFSYNVFVWSYTDFCSSQTDNVWGGVSGNNNDRRGPCSAGYHIPTNAEWTGIVTAGGWGTQTTMRDALKLPFAGYRAYGNTSLYDEGLGAYYWSSTPNGTSDAYKLFIGAGGPGSRSYGLPVRCLRN